MDSLARLFSLFALGAAIALTAPAAADYDGADGYGQPAGDGFGVSHDGYQREGQTGATPDATTYVVIESADGTTEVVDGETVIVVQEPEPLAATEQAPPAPQTVVVVQPEVQCPGAIWVDGHWAYSNGDYVWVDGHCVVERVNYVFVQPRWDFYSNVWWFVPGYYRPWGVYVGFGYYRPWHWFPPHRHAFYRTRHPVPVHRGVPYRRTTVRARPPAVRSSRGVVRPTGAVGRARTSPTRTQTVARAPSRRAGTVTRAPSRRAGTVTRAPSTRTGTVTRTRPATSRVDSVNRVRTTPSRTTVVHRPPGSATSARAVGRARGGPALTSSVPRSRANTAAVGRPRVSSSRTSSVVRRPASTTSPAKVNRPVSRRPSSSRASSFQGSRTRPTWGGGSSRTSSGWSRPSTGRGGSVGRPSSGGFSRVRSVPTARSR
ncbi:MAG: BcpO-related WXXGXW repeat protein [Myxococcales bacterium]|nr:BcpO-related WXXGXW repeat protein [Myxococcales bacterium]